MIDQRTAVWRKDPGDVDTWVMLAVAFASAITIAIVGLGGHYLYEQDPTLSHDYDAFWFRGALPVALCMVFTLLYAPGWRIARSIRAAVLLPVVHLGLVVAAWRAWVALSPNMPYARESSPAFDLFPVQWVIASVVGVCVVGGLVIARQRRGEWIHASVMIALALLLAFGLWLPIAATFWSGTESWRVYWTADGFVLDSPCTLLGLLVAPPVIAALAFTWHMFTRTVGELTKRNTVPILVGITLAVGVLARLGVNAQGALLYANFIHFLLALVIVALAAIIALGVVTRLRARVRGTAVTGVIATDSGEAVAGFQITSWLRGPTPVMKPFVVATDRGDLPVPDGAGLVAPYPAMTTQLHVGESVPVLSAGDRVTLLGYDVPDASHPFRESTMPIAGVRGVTVVAERGSAGAFADVALAMWRPCVAYLVIVVAVALPALAAVFANP